MDMLWIGLLCFVLGAVIGFVVGESKGYWKAIRQASAKQFY